MEQQGATTPRPKYQPPGYRQPTPVRDARSFGDAQHAAAQRCGLEAAANAQIYRLLLPLMGPADFKKPANEVARELQQILLNMAAFHENANTNFTALYGQGAVVELSRNFVAKYITAGTKESYSALKKWMKVQKANMQQ